MCRPHSASQDAMEAWNGDGTPVLQSALANNALEVPAT